MHKKATAKVAALAEDRANPDGPGDFLRLPTEQPMRCNTITLLLLASTISLTACRSETADKEAAARSLPPTQKATKASTPTEDSLDRLARRFLIAIQENDIDGFSSCWPTLEDFETLTDQPPPGTQASSEEEYSETRESLSRRDRLVRLIFPWIRRAIIDKCGSLGTIKVLEVRADVLADFGSRHATNVVVVLSGSANFELEFGMNTAAFFTGRWRFSDKPPATFLLTTGEGTVSETVFANEYATEREFSDFKKLIPR